MNTARLTLIAALAAAHTLGAQGPSVLQLDRTFHFGQIATVMPDPASGGGLQRLYGSVGTLALRATGLGFTATMDEQEVDELRTIQTRPSSAVGSYHVTTDSRLQLESGGARVFEGILAGGADVILGGRRDPSFEARSLIALRTSVGATNARLSGRYHVSQIALDFPDLNGLATYAAVGIATFSGAGGFSLTGQQRSIDAFGVITPSPLTRSGSYTVQSDGALGFGAHQRGAVSSDGDVFFVTTLDPTRTGLALMVGVRIGAAYDFGMLEGDYGAVSHSTEVGTFPASPLVHTTWNELELVATSPTAGLANLTSIGIESDATGLRSSTDSVSGTASLGAEGVVTLVDPGDPTPAILAFAPNGSFFVRVELLGRAEMVLGVRTCGHAAPYGTATPGTGGIAPVTSMRGFPRLGNATFGLGVADAIGGATASMLVTTRSLPGVPLLGGTIWVDPGRLLASVPLSLSGSPGAPGAGAAMFTLPLSTDPALLSIELFVQSLIFDPGAPGSIAMTSGFRLGFCR